MKVFIFGYRGNMGSRYRAILESLGHTWDGYDCPSTWTGTLDPDVDAVIIATPTDTHMQLIRHLAYCGRPILVEKPITKNIYELESLVDFLKTAGTRLQMVNQYDHLVKPGSEGPTVYDYFKHGTDGIFWDCISIVYHAQGRVELREDSPVWRCIVNGYALDLADMDHAYIDMVDRWLKDPRSDLERILEAHRKVAELEKSHCPRC